MFTNFNDISGSRGIRLEVGPGEKATENKMSEEHFTNSSIVEQVKYVVKDGYGLGKFTFYYIPTSDGYHNFYLYGLCDGQLWMSLSESDAGDEMISMDPAMKVCHKSTYTYSVSALRNL